MMASFDIVHVVVAPPPALEENLIRKVSAIVNKDPYEVRLLLAGEIPRVIAHYGDPQTAVSATQNLRDLGLVAIDCKDSELRERSLRFRAHTMEFEEKRVIPQDNNGQVTRVGDGDVFLILNGRMQTYKETARSTTKMEFSLAATALTCSIPIWRRVREKSNGVSLDARRFVRLYNWQSSESTVELLQDDMDYSFLGAKMTLSALANFSTVVTKLREAFPQAVFDEGLMKPLEADDLEANCKLIYLYHLTLKNLSTFG